MPKPTYITTPIYYVNDRPHIGHCYTSSLADCLTRCTRLVRGHKSDVFFLTGTDEHADKVVTSAAKHGMTPIQWSDKNAAEFERAFKFCGLDYDDFIRTTQERHKTKVLEYIRELQRRGDVYLGTYEGWWDTSQEEYLTDTAAKEAGYNSPVNGSPLVKRTEKNYFFKLSAYENRLKAHLDTNPHFVLPESRRNEVLGRMREGLQDIPISRGITDDPTSQWGIRMPDDPTHRIYVWIDALFNYLTVVDTPERINLWPADVHFMAKDILWFHAVIWPCLLMALDRPLPRTVYVHSYWVREGRKMSKTLGNFVSIEVIEAYANKYSIDAVRWYLLTQGPSGNSDADFSHSKFVEVFNADLANGIGNCTSRVGNMIDKYFGGVLPAPRSEAAKGWRFKDAQGIESTWDWEGLCAARVSTFAAALETCDLSQALAAGIDLVRHIDQYINTTAPFKMAKRIEAEPAIKDDLATVLYHCAEAIRIASYLLSPALITKAPALWATWACAPAEGVPLVRSAAFAGEYGLKAGAKVGKGENLFMRADAAEAAPA